MRQLALKGEYRVGRPLKTLIPLIDEELVKLDESGHTHYERIGALLAEAKPQIPNHRWPRWLSQHFQLSRDTARRYLLFYERKKTGKIPAGETQLLRGIGETSTPGPVNTAVKELRKKMAKVLDISGLLEERHAVDHEILIRRKLAIELITMGYRALATRLHPDRGGSKDAMVRLGEIRGAFITFAKRSRFV